MLQRQLMNEEKELFKWMLDPAPTKPSAIPEKFATAKAFCRCHERNHKAEYYQRFQEMNRRHKGSALFRRNEKGDLLIYIKGYLPQDGLKFWLIRIKSLHLIVEHSSRNMKSQVLIYPSLSTWETNDDYVWVRFLDYTGDTFNNLVACRELPSRQEFRIQLEDVLEHEDSIIPVIVEQLGERICDLLSIAWAPTITRLREGVYQLKLEDEKEVETLVGNPIMINGRRVTVNPLRTAIDITLNPKTRVLGEYAGTECPASEANNVQLLAMNGLSQAVEVIQGPPGTGKSTLIAKIIKHRIPRSKHVLVTCTRNFAIDSVAEKLCNDEIKFLVFGNHGRVGPTARAHLFQDEIAKKCKSDQNSFAKRDKRRKVMARILESNKVFLATIGSLPAFQDLVLWSGQSIHTVIVDEAGCTQEIEMVRMLLLNPKNVIHIGDHKQLRPGLEINCYQQGDPERSQMERLVDAGISYTLLTIQYRMHRDICHIVSKLSYDGQLETGDILREMNPAVCWIDHSCREVSRGLSFVNSGEAKEVVKAFQAEGSRSSHTLVITFYKPQVKVLREAFVGTKGRPPRVITVDSAQGTEAEIVILSCVRCNKQGNVGFVRDLRRLNVAISRARQKLIIVGNLETMCSDPNWHVVASETRRLSGLPPLPDQTKRKLNTREVIITESPILKSEISPRIDELSHEDDKPEPKKKSTSSSVVDPSGVTKAQSSYQRPKHRSVKRNITVETVQLYFTTTSDRKTDRVQFRYPFKSIPEVLVRVLTKGLWVKVVSVGKGFFVFRACLLNEGDEKPGKYTFQYKAEPGALIRN